MTKEEAKKFGLQLLHGIMERNESYPVYANNVKQAIEALSETSGSSEIPNDLQEYASRAGFDYVDNIVQEHPGHRFNDHDVEYAYRDGIIAGAKWQKGQNDKDLSEKIAAAYQLGLADKEERMMKEAVEGEVCIPNVWVEHKEGKELVVRAEISKELGFKFGDVVRIIIVKED